MFSYRQVEHMELISSKFDDIDVSNLKIIDFLNLMFAHLPRFI